MKKVIIVHGFGGTKDSNWFGWLATELKASGFEVWCQSLPDTDQPDPKVWTTIVSQACEPGCILIGHSLGGPTILRVAEMYDNGISALFSVAGFARKLHLPFDDQIDPFTRDGFDFATIADHVSDIHIWDSDNDMYVGLEEGAFLAEQLPSQRRTFPGRGHFMESRFPELLEAVLQSEKNV